MFPPETCSPETSCAVTKKDPALCRRPPLFLYLAGLVFSHSPTSVDVSWKPPKLFQPENASPETLSPAEPPACFFGFLGLRTPDAGESQQAGVVKGIKMN